MRVTDDFAVMFADVRKHFHVNAGARYHCENLACRRLYRHETPDLVLHQCLTVLLKVRVNGSDHVFSRYCLLVHFAVLVTRLDLVVRVPQIDMITFLSLQVLLPCRFYTGLSCIVAGTVLSGMPLDERLVHFRDISEKISSGIDRIIPDASDLSADSGELVLDLCEFHVGGSRYLLEHYH